MSSGCSWRSCSVSASRTPKVVSVCEGLVSAILGLLLAQYGNSVTVWRRCMSQRICDKTHKYGMVAINQLTREGLGRSKYCIIKVLTAPVIADTLSEVLSL